MFSNFHAIVVVGLESEDVSDVSRNSPDSLSVSEPDVHILSLIGMGSSLSGLPGLFIVIDNFRLIDGSVDRHFRDLLDRLFLGNTSVSEAVAILKSSDFLGFSLVEIEILSVDR